MSHAVGSLSSFAHTQRAFTAHLRAPEVCAAPADVPTARMALYRELVYGNVERMIGNLFPVLRRITPEERWFALVRDFFQRHHCRAGLFAKVPLEFLHYVEHERDATGDPAFLGELVHYEWVDYATTTDPRDPDWHGVDPGGSLLDGIPVLNPLARLLNYRFPVHRIAPDYLPEAPPAAPTYLVVCRDRRDQVGFIDLNPVAARLLALINEDRAVTGRALLERIAAELGHPDPATVLAGGAGILARLQTRDVILGVRRDAP